VRIANRRTRLPTTYILTLCVMSTSELWVHQCLYDGDRSAAVQPWIHLDL